MQAFENIKKSVDAQFTNHLKRKEDPFKKTLRSNRYLPSPKLVEKPVISTILFKEKPIKRRKLSMKKVRLYLTPNEEITIKDGEMPCLGVLGRNTARN